MVPSKRYPFLAALRTAAKTAKQTGRGLFSVNRTGCGQRLAIEAENLTWCLDMQLSLRLRTRGHPGSSSSEPISGFTLLAGASPAQVKKGEWGVSVPELSLHGWRILGLDYLEVRKQVAAYGLERRMKRELAFVTAGYDRAEIISRYREAIGPYFDPDLLEETASA